MAADREHVEKVWHRGLISQLEPRLMYDGAAAAVAVEIAATTDSGDAAESQESPEVLTPITETGTSEENTPATTPSENSAEDVLEALGDSTLSEEATNDETLLSSLDEMEVAADTTNSEPTDPKDSQDAEDLLEALQEDLEATESEDVAAEDAVDDLEQGPETQTPDDSIATEVENQSEEIAFIDASVEDAETIETGIESGIQVYHLDSNSSGLSQMTEILEDKSDVSAIHIFSHGSGGDITLGSEHLTSSNIESKTEELTTIGKTLSSSSDILIYGCNVGEDQNFIKTLSDITEADIAASDDKTGSELLAGDWNLEVTEGSIETSSQSIFGYTNLLGTPTIAGGNPGFESGLTGWTTTAGVASADTYDISTTDYEWSYDSAGSGMAVLNPSGEMFDTSFTTKLEVSEASKDYISDTFYSNSNKRPTDYASITSTFSATAGDSFTIAWNYTSTDYTPFNDGSVLSVVNTDNAANVAILDNVQAEVLILGATNPGTGNYTTGSYGSTGWQTTTVTIQTTGNYLLGLSVFNLGDTAYDPYLLVDDGLGTTTRDGDPFDPIEPDENAPPPAGDVVGGNATLPSQNEDSTPGGETVSTLFTDLYSGTLGGVAISADGSSPSEGTWEYSTNSGTTWYSVGTVSDSAALLLNTTSKLRFLPAENWNGEPGNLSAHIVDTSFSDSYTNGATRATFNTTTDDNSIVSETAKELETSISAVNDAPEITGGPDSDTLTESRNVNDLTSSGSLTVTDVETTDVVTATVDSVAPAGDTGGLSNDDLRSLLTVSPSNILNSSTSTATLDWSFSADSDSFAYLAEGETLTLVYTIKATDNASPALSDTETVTINISGSNDANSVSATSSSEVTEQVDGSSQSLSDSGTVSFDDVDGSDVIDITFANAGNVVWSDGTIDNDLATKLQAGFSTGTTDAAAPGTTPWTYSVADADLDFLGKDETITFGYTITATDNQGLTSNTSLNFLITGTNDAPTVSVTASAAITEQLDASSQNINDSGTVNFGDIDENDLIDITFASNDDIAWSSGTIDSSLATKLVNGFNTGTTDAAAPGSTPWTYAVTDADLNFLAKDETITFSYTITAKDSNNDTDTKTISFSITGTNDDPTVTATSSTLVTELSDGSTQNLSDSGTVSFDDVDVNDVIDITFTSNGDIAWSGGTIENSLATQLVAGFSTGTTDADAPDAVGWSFDVAGANLDFLAQGETITFSYTVTATDNNGGQGSTTVSFTITSTNDEPSITVEDGDSVNGKIVETDSTVSTSGSLTVTDLDLTDILTVDVTVAADQQRSNGSSMRSDSGEPSNANLRSMFTATSQPVDQTEQSGPIEWRFNSGDEPFDYLAQGEKLVLVYTLTVTDSQGASDTQDVKVTITGTNDDPVITTTASSPLVEADGATTTSLRDSGTVSFTDLDGTDVISVSLKSNNDISWSGGAIDSSVAAKLLSGFSTGATNSEAPGSIAWNYEVPGIDLNFLGKNETISFSYTVTVTDNNGAAASEVIDFTITGSNDSALTRAVSAPQNGQASDSFEFTVPPNTFSELDTNDTLSYAVEGLPAGLTFSGDSMKISGSPSQAGTFLITIIAKDQHGSESRVSFSLVVDPAPVTEETVIPLQQQPEPSVDPQILVNTSPPPLPSSAPAPLPAIAPLLIPTEGSQPTGTAGPGGSSLPVLTDSQGPPDAIVGGEFTGGETYPDTPSTGEPSVFEFNSDGGNSTGNNDGGREVFNSTEVVRVDDAGRLQFAPESDRNSAVTLSVESLEIDNNTGALSVKLYTGGNLLTSNFAVSQENGQPLPEWLNIDPINGTISGQPPEGVEKISLKIEVTNAEGKAEVLNLTILLENENLEEEQEQNNVESQSIDTSAAIPGLPEFSAQLAEIGESENKYSADLLMALA